MFGEMTINSPHGAPPPMMKLPSLAGLEGLLNLDRQGVDIRPTLLRVITDQYLQKAVHTPEEERQFTELALRLLDETEIPTRAAVAKRLAPHAIAPRAIVAQLARDVIEVAEPILLHSPCLTPDDLSAIAAERGPTYADIIATRGQPEPSPPVAAVVAPPPARPRTAPFVNKAQLDRDSDMLSGVVAVEAWELCELFFGASAEERRLILTTLDYVPTVPARPPAALQRTDIWHLESAALQHNTEAVVRELEHTLGISHRLARRIVGDELGEPIVVAAKALALPADVLQRMLLFLNPRVGQSVDRVYELAALYNEITVDSAHRLIDIWQDADPAEAQPATHAAQWQSTVEHARQALSDISRRPPARREQPSIVPPRRAVGTDRP
jgi:hypothetical protein